MSTDETPNNPAVPGDTAVAPEGTPVVEPRAVREAPDPNLTHAVADANATTTGNEAEYKRKIAQLENEAEALRLRAQEAEERAANPAARTTANKRVMPRTYTIPEGVSSWSAAMVAFKEDVRDADNAPDNVGTDAELLAYNREQLSAHAQARGFGRFAYTYDQPTENPDEPPRPRVDYHVFPGEVIEY